MSFTGNLSDGENLNNCRNIDDQLNIHNANNPSINECTYHTFSIRLRALLDTCAGNLYETFLILSYVASVLDASNGGWPTRHS